MARTCFILMLSTLLVVGVLPITAAVPDVDEEIYWFHVVDDEGDEPEGCSRLVDMDESAPTPCDIVSFEAGNSETHLVSRVGVATTDFGTTGQFGFVDYIVEMRSEAEDDNTYETTVRLRSDGGLELQGTTPEGWSDAVEVALEGNMIVVALPLDQLGGILLEDEPMPHITWLNVTSVQSAWGLIEEVNGSGPLSHSSADAISGLADEPPLVIQAYGALKTPKIDPILIEETFTGDSFHVEEAFSTSPPNMDDPCVPWNETCFMAAQPVTAHYAYHWALDLPTVELSIQQEIVNGTVDLVVFDEFDFELVRIASGEALDAEVLEEIRPVQTQVLTFIVELDRFEGSFEITAKEGAPLEDEENGDTDHSGHDMDGSDDGNTTGEVDNDLEESGGIPGPGVVVLLALLAGILRIRRRG